MAQAPDKPMTYTVDGEVREMPAALLASLPKAAEAPRYLVPRLLVVERLEAAGKLRAALEALQLETPAADLPDPMLAVRERWLAASGIYSDDAQAIGLMQAIGADPTAILAPE